MLYESSDSTQVSDMQEYKLYSLGNTGDTVTLTDDLRSQAIKAFISANSSYSTLESDYTLSKSGYYSEFDITNAWGGGTEYTTGKSVTLSDSAEIYLFVKYIKN